MTDRRREEVDAISLSDQLCQTCQNIFQAQPAKETSSEHLSASQCHKAAYAGCALCYRIWQHATKHGQIDVLALLPGEGFTGYTVEPGDRHQLGSWKVSFMYSGLGEKLGENPAESFARHKAEFVLEPLAGLCSSLHTVFECLCSRLTRC